MNAANRRLLIAGFAVILSTTAFTANAQYFSSEGRSGLYREYFLQSVEATGVEDNRIVTVIASDNRGESETSEFVVNCNDTMAQILMAITSITRLMSERNRLVPTGFIGNYGFQFAGKIQRSFRSEQKSRSGSKP
ncbi:hypothetical protein HED54_04540 [Ochrobactrum anthropi ATCC 49188]|nr:hypothetical protein [Brucella anthropi ATCC 49188]